jgi:hypothetical protein
MYITHGYTVWSDNVISQYIFHGVISLSLYARLDGRRVAFTLHGVPYIDITVVFHTSDLFEFVENGNESI